MQIEKKILLREAIVRGGWTIAGLAKEFDVNRATVRWWMDRELEYVLGYGSVKEAARARGMGELRYREVHGDKIVKI